MVEQLGLEWPTPEQLSGSYTSRLDCLLPSPLSGSRGWAGWLDRRARAIILCLPLQIDSV
eukprot:365587-Chlamydomonas_euryale.AAC.5